MSRLYGNPEHRADALKPLWAEVAAEAWDESDRQRSLAKSALYDVATTDEEKTRLAEALQECRVAALGPLKVMHRKGPDGKRHWELRE